MQWPSFLGKSRIDDFINPDGGVIEPPHEGTLPAAVSMPLRALLKSHTECPDVWLAIWQGYGWDYRNFIPDTTSIKTNQREWDLFRGPLDMLDVSFYETNQTANMIWPDDRRWCLAIDIDLNTTYIGGSAPLIEDLINADDLEVWPAKPEDDITYGADTLNTC